MELTIFAPLFAPIGCGVLVGVPLAIYRVTAHSHRSSWNAARASRVMAGPYRAMTFDLPVRVRVPNVVIAASLATFYMLVPSLALLPFMMMGVCNEIESRTVGPAIIFGPQGIVLTIATMVLGARLLRRAPLGRKMRAIPVWQIAFAIALALATLRIGDEAPLLVSYAIASALHACLLRAAIASHRRATFAT